jgi:hypothetical protein
MSNILTKLTEIRSKAVLKAETRDKKYLKRSEKWQASATGVLYDSETESWADLISHLDTTIEAAKILKDKNL